MFQVSLELPGDGPGIEYLLDRSFGPSRLDRAAYCLRADNPPLAELCFVIRERGSLCAAIRYWQIMIAGNHPALLLGPLAVGQSWRGRGFGGALISHSLARAKALGHGAVLVIGDPDYYRPFGFSASLAANLELPKPAAPGCLQARELAPGALSGRAGRLAVFVLE